MVTDKDQHVAGTFVRLVWQLCHGCANPVVPVAGIKLKGVLVRDSLGFIYCTQQCCDAFQIYVKPYRDKQVAAYAQAHHMSVQEAAKQLKAEALEVVIEDPKASKKAPTDT